MTGSRPLFSVVTAVHDDEPHLSEFIASIEAQRFDIGRIEVIAVDDGSTDGSLAMLEAWAARRPSLVTVLRQPNGGTGSGRNRGLERAAGEWVTFIDPGDVLERDFFSVAQRFALAHPDVEVLAGRPRSVDGAEGPITDSQRRREYDAGNRRVDLEVESDSLATSVVSLFRLDRVRSQGFAFDARLRPTFEGGHFTTCFLLSLERTVVGVLRDATYIARGGSAMQSSSRDPGKHIDVFRFGYLDTMQRARARHGSVPAWLQHVLIDELARYLAEDEKLSTTIRIAEEEVPTFHDLLCEVIAQLDPEVVQAHTARRLKSVWTDILAYGCRPHDWHSRAIARTKVDRQVRLQRIGYRYVGTPPREEFLVDGVAVRPAYGKTRSHLYYGRSLMEERIAWLPIGAVEVRLDDRPYRVVDGWPAPGVGMRSMHRPGRLARYRAMTMRRLIAGASRRTRPWRVRIVTTPWRLIARVPPYRSAYRDAWVLMDRILNSDDNAERLFEYLRAERPDVNAWFVVAKGTSDWERMRAAGESRLVAHGSFRWTMLMLNSAWLLSSHVGPPVAEPPHVLRITGRPTWKYAFLQHGVMKDDLSRWFNRRDIDLLVVSSEDELKSVTADGTGYVCTTKETRNTGLPRFDRLLAKGLQVAPDERDLVIVAPTWRTYLTFYVDPAVQARAIEETFWDSDYLRNWNAILRSPEIAAAAARRGWRVAFMPHPIMQAALPRIDLPGYVEPLTFEGNDVQAIYARCALLVTDYSSVAFNAAYLDRPVVYYQFDRDEVMSGSHLGRKGYFEYDRDGFGPVVTEASDAVRAIVAAIEHGPQPAPEYQARIDRTFVDRDGQACARVVVAVEELSRPYRAV